MLQSSTLATSLRRHAVASQATKSFKYEREKVKLSWTESYKRRSNKENTEKETREK